MLRDTGYDAAQQKLRDAAQPPVAHYDQIKFSFLDQMENAFRRVAEFYFGDKRMRIAGHFFFRLFEKGLSRLLDIVDITWNKLG